MQAITWSQDLSSVIKDIKELTNKGVTNISKTLSQKEKQAVSSVFGVKSQKVEVQQYWT